MLVRTLNAIASGSATAAMWVSAGLLVYIVIHVNIEIVLRSFFDTSSFSMDEFVGYAIGAMTFLSLAHTFKHRKHIRVSILQSFVRGKLAAAVELLCIALTFGITLFLARFIWRTLARDFQRGTVSPTLTETPIWLIDSAIFLGLVFFLIQLLSSACSVVCDGVPKDRVQGK
ncbi:TRAP transporter small permease subunit [Pelagibius sp. Alg239-R121]|uniref:TRAP transporter small permease subunit n=1 Tax=Pelagibius sp. Alg239-R121 TaxID=2993448 RepID=UPI0024A6148B|nr:TRAP transporter small permease [Pelagibius sp. Alg239-R121]